MYEQLVERVCNIKDEQEQLMEEIEAYLDARLEVEEQ